MFRRFTNEASTAAPAEARSGIIRGPQGTQFSAVLLDQSDPLPAPARARLTSLQTRHDDARMISRSLSERKQELIPERQRWAIRLSQLQGRDGVSRPVGDEHPAVREAQAKVEALDREMQALQGRIDDAAAMRQLLGSIVSNCENWIKQLTPDVKVEVAKVMAPKLAKGETALEAIERIRVQLAELRADKAETLAAPIPSSTAKAIMRRQVAELAAKGRPNVDGLIEGAEEITWPMQQRQGALGGHVQLPDGSRAVVVRSDDARPRDGFALTCWLLEDALVKRLEREIDEASDDGAALTDEARAKKINQIDQRALECEYAEVLLIAAANDAADFRPDTDPRALLQVTGPALREF
jgi:hypothetical protein